MRRRGEYVERTFSHVYDTGGMRRTHLCGHQNILKRLIVHAAGFNLGLLMRSLVGVGKPRRLQGAAVALIAVLSSLRRGEEWLRTLLVHIDDALSLTATDHHRSLPGGSLAAQAT